MNRQDFYSDRYNNGIDRAMEPEQFTQVIEAILAGKYSWACVLILRFAGYNPLHYIPYRTYNRLVKDNTANRRKQPCQISIADNHSSMKQVDHRASNLRSHKISDLTYSETVNDQAVKVQGGYFSQWFAGKFHR